MQDEGCTLGTYIMIVIVSIDYTYYIYNIKYLHVIDTNTHHPQTCLHVMHCCVIKLILSE